MKLSQKTELILFTLGEFYNHVNRELKKKNIEVILSKTEFIKMVQLAKIAQKQPRAIYRNLELLEKKKLLLYTGKTLILTARGKKYVQKMEKKLKPYLTIIDIVKQHKPERFVRRQTKLLS